ACARLPLALAEHAARALERAARDRRSGGRVLRPRAAEATCASAGARGRDGRGAARSDELGTDDGGPARAGPLIPFHVVEQALEVGPVELGDCALVLLHRPGPEVEIQLRHARLD